MPLLLIAYNVPQSQTMTAEEKKEADKRRGDLLKIVQRHPHRLLSESAYAIETNGSAESYLKEVLSICKEGDRAYVIPLIGPGIAYGPPETTQWLNTRLIAPPAQTEPKSTYKR